MRRVASSPCVSCGRLLVHADGGHRHLCSRCGYPRRSGVVSKTFGVWVISEHVDDVTEAVLDAKESGACLVTVEYDDEAAVA